MRSPHFFKAYCRLGLNGHSTGPNDLLYGVEKAPDHILTDDFLNQFKNTQISDFRFINYENKNPHDFYDSVINQTLEFRNKINGSLKSYETAVIIGGDHFVTFPSILSDIKRFGVNIGIIHFDSHADINQYYTSPSKNLHGVYLRILTDKFDLKVFDNLVPAKIPLSNFIFIGDLELDTEEENYLKENNSNVITHFELLENKIQSLVNIKNFIENFDHIHISFDVDVFKSSIVSATTTPSKNGFEKEPIFEILEIIKNVKSFTLDIAEVNPKKKGAVKTIKIVQEVISSLI